MTPRDRRAVILGTAILGISVVGLRVLPAAGRWVAALRSAAREERALLRRAQSVLGARSAVADSLHRALNAIVALAPRLVEGHTQAESQAGLTSLVSMEAGRHALKVVRLDPLPDSATGVFMRVALRAELEGDIAGVVGLVRRIETSDPTLSATGLRISALDPASGKRVPEVLRVEMNVAGYYLPRAAR